MAAFFSLGSANCNSQQHPNTNTNTNTNINLASNPTSDSNPSEPTSWWLYTTARNPAHDHHRPTTATKDFELWQQPNLLADTAGPMGGGGGGGGGGGDGRLINFADESTWGSSAGFVMMGCGSGSGGSGGGMSCQDCGNQAKKDCPHMRCRTCCKSRGFQCQTHVKSTWVPAAKRRERQQYLSATQQDHNRRRVLHNTKRARSTQDHHNNNANLVNPITTTAVTATAIATAAVAYNSSGFEVGNFPSELTTPANFRCVRVSSVDETDDQFAYQAAVNIGGHTFKGILYDQGPEGQYMGGDTSSGGSAGIPQLNLTTTAATSPGGSTAAANFIGHSLYPSLGGNDYMTSTPFFHQISRD